MSKNKDNKPDDTQTTTAAETAGAPPKDSKNKADAAAAMEPDNLPEAPGSPEAGTPKIARKTVQAWAEIKRYAAWQTAALARYAGWTLDKHVTEAEIDAALEAAMRKPQGLKGC